MKWLKNNKGSSTVLLAMVFVTMMICISSAIIIARALVVKSECQSMGTMWTKAILSEYDVHLLEDYGIMAYFGNEAEVQKRIDAYVEYSASNKMDVNVGKCSAELSGFELGRIDVFRGALKKAFPTSELSNVLDDNSRKVREDEKIQNREIRNNVVLDTLPSNGNDVRFDIGTLAKNLENESSIKNLKNKIVSKGINTTFIYNYLSNYVSTSSHNDGYFRNEWEYLINGKCDDEANYKACRNYIFAIRNAMNLAYLYSDADKKAVIVAVSEMLTPGGAGIITQAVVAEMWAVIETNKDMDVLFDNGRVPFVKTDRSWKTNLDELLSSEGMKNKIKENGVELGDENENSLIDMKGSRAGSGSLDEGQNYDEYLLALISLLNDDTITLRIMDLIQINMKYRYYEDFNMMEYFVGTRFSIRANGKDYEFEDSYK